MCNTGYKDAEKYINDIPFFGVGNTPDKVAVLLRELIPADGKMPSVIHIAGTNGKGSCASYIHTILRCAGYSAGLFTSPHFLTMRERIVYNETMISEDEFLNAHLAVKAVVDKRDENIDHPSFFEYIFLMAMWYYARTDCDYIVLETGLGGRLDATNAVPDKKLCLITDIDYDHTKYLGDTLPLIAAEKAGIIKEGVPVVYYDKSEEIGEVIRQRAKELNCKCYGIKKEDISLLTLNKQGIDFSLFCEYYSFDTLKIKSIAPYQMINASLSAVCAMVLGDDAVDERVVRSGLLKSFWSGRFERVSDELVLDGAHNPDGMRAFLSAVCNMKADGNRYLIFAVAGDKDYSPMIKMIGESGLFKKVYITTTDNSRSLDPSRIRELFDDISVETECFMDPEDAYKAALSGKNKEDIVFAAGSLYLVAKIKEILGKDE